jgi:hypothetical protein
VGRTVKMSAADVRERAASNAVHAAIAAADALCGNAHGHHASGSDHREAIGLLRAVRGDGPRLATRLARLLSSKTEFTYGGFCNRAEAERATSDAGALVDELDRLNL